MIVFPEYGLMPLGGPLASRDMALVFMEQVPDPHSGEWIPCVDPPAADPDPLAVQRALSCMARDSRLYVVANVGTRQPCDRLTDSSSTCPDDGRYQYNTNVAYDPTGRLVCTLLISTRFSVV